MLGRKIETQITEYLFHKATLEQRPIAGTFELSPLCNFNCKMCYVHQSEKQLKESGKELLPAEFWLNLAKEAREKGMLYLLLTGGEPFLYRDFWKLYEGLVDMGFVLSINSNGSLIDESIVERLKKNPPTRINITLYGASNETYERLCGVKNGYTRTVRAIQLLKEAGIQVKLNCSLTPSNAEDLEKMVHFAEEQKLILEIETYMFPPIRLDCEMAGKNHRFTPEEMAHYNLSKVYHQYGEESFRKYVDDLENGITTMEPGDTHCKETEGDQIKCRAGRAIFWTTWEGKITPCAMMPIPSVSLKNHTFEEAWKELAEETAKVRLAPECKECSNRKICHACAGMVYAESNDFAKKPQYLCEYTQAMREKCIACQKVLDQEKQIQKNEK